jgi:isoleucyl-tRNA synthetase
VAGSQGALTPEPDAVENSVKGKQKMFEAVNSRQDFPKLEEEMLSWWNEKDIPRKYRERNNDSDKRWSFIDGPITANNPMGVHHAWGRSYKDLFLRFRNMQGYKQRFQNGFDGQGLWIEVEVEKELGFKSKLDIEKYGVGDFVELCKQRVDKFADIISEQSKRLAMWMDWDNSYHTKSDENNYTIWHFLKTCLNKGLLYEGTDVMPWCPRCSSGLSEHEIVTEGYREIVHPGLFVKFPLLDRENESLLVWTTTPWTMTSNVAAAVNPDLDYVKVQQGDDKIYLVKNRVSILQGDYEVLEEMTGDALVGLRYSGPFDELPAQQGVEHRVIPWDEVLEDEGTGIVHSAPGAGKEDFALGKEFDLAVIAPLDEFGVFIDGFGSFTGQSVFDVNDEIYDSLKSKGMFYHLERYTHRYPFCWRCGTELVFRLVDEWFISMDPIRESMKRITQTIRWVPEFGMRRELDWLDNMDDWMISKKRYYGLALPIYKCEDCGHFDVMGSETELEERAIEGWDEFEGHSPHRPWVDAVKIACSECGSKVSRIREVGNPWLDAGIAPFSTLGYRHGSDQWKEWFPADWISESFPGQFRNWFYSMIAMATVLEDTTSFKSVFSYALMRNEKGQEMHKSAGTAIWFEDAAEKMGVDSMRWVFARHDPAANINFGYGSADEVRRQFIIPLWNVYSFFVTYAEIDQFDPKTPSPPVAERAELDRWILSELNQLVAEVTNALENFEPQTAARRSETFVESLSNWYVRRSRRRFWKSGLLSEEGGGDQDKLAAYATLYEVLVTLSKLLAPMMPFVTESIYQNLVVNPGLGRESVHLDDYPVADESIIDTRLTDVTRLAMRLSSMGRAARSKASIKVRQPLATAMIKTRTTEERSLLEQAGPQIMDELNVREIVAFDADSEVVNFKLQANMPILGPKYGMELHYIIEALNEADPQEVAAKVEAGEGMELGGYDLEPGEILVSSSERDSFSVSADAGYTVAIATEITPELRLEGQARELVHRIQNMRRSAEFDIADHIVTYYQGDDRLTEVIRTHSEYIMQETLSDQLLNTPMPPDTYSEQQNFDGIQATIGLVRKA